MKLLLSAFACEPGLGSEEGVGWNMAIEAAREHQVWVLTRGFCAGTIEPYLAQNPIPNLQFIYFEPFGWSEDWKGRQGLLIVHYYLWQIWAYFVARKWHQKIQFDLARHVTYVRYWNPSFLALLPIPLMWGPVGGGESAPAPFWRDFNLRGKVYEAMRDTARWLGEHDPFVGLTARRSAIALAATEQTAVKLRRLGAKRVEVTTAIALSTAEINTLAQAPPPPTGPMRFLSVGRLIHWKGLHLSLRAFAAADLPTAEYWIIGEGVERSRLEALVAALGVGDRVRFWGLLPRGEVLAKMGECHALIHPSLHESGGFVCAEMMAARRPVICLNWGGPGVQVTPETGILIPAENPTQVIHDLAQGMEKLAANREGWGEAGYDRVRSHFSWETKGQYFNQLYRQLSTKNHEDFSPPT